MAENASEIRLRHLLERIQALAEEVRRTALRVHQETEEAHRLAAIVRSELERSRELSRSSRDQATCAWHDRARCRDRARQRPPGR